MNTNPTRTTLALCVLIVLAGLAGVYLSCMTSAATIDLRPAVEAARGSIPAVSVGKSFRLYRQVDFGTDEVTTGTYAEILTIPANTIIREVIQEVVTAEGETATCDMYFKDTKKVSNTNYNSSSSGVPALSLSQSSAFCVDELTTVSLCPDNELDHAVVKIWITGERLPEAD